MLWINLGVYLSFYLEGKKTKNILDIIQIFWDEFSKELGDSTSCLSESKSLDLLNR